MRWSDDQELFELTRQKLFTAIIGDVLDILGCRCQFLPARCKPLAPRMQLAGRAMTVVEADIFHLPEPPFGKMLNALDDLRPNEVYIAAGCAPRYALWGELMSLAAAKRGAVGAVLAGYSRDTSGILAANFPTFSYGTYALDQRGRGVVTDFRVPLEIEGVQVNPGDMIVGDSDGVVVVPRILEEEVISRALEQVSREKEARTMLLNSAWARDVFTETGVL